MSVHTEFLLLILALMNELYRHTSYFRILYGFYAVLLIFSFTLWFMVHDWEKRILVILFPLILISLSIVAFHKLEITLTPSELKIRFGIGWFKKTVPLDRIDPDSIHVTKVSPFIGVGLRYDLKGNVYYSVKFGKTVGFKLQHENQKIYLGTHHPEELAKELRQAVADS